MLVYRTKNYAAITNYDRYNSLRGMTDSDVLAEDKLKNPYTVGKVVGNTAMGAAAGATVGAMTNLFRPGKTVLRGGKTGAILGGVGSAAYSMIRRSREGDKISEYNSRLDDAKRTAMRRERLDWYRNQQGRTDYTY
jgi:hypothetical protein